MPSIEVPKFDLSDTNFISKSDFEKAYNIHQAIHIRGFGTSNGKFTVSDVKSLFHSLNDQDKESWCIENKSNDVGNEVASSDFLDVKRIDQRGYCSFLVQHSNDVMKDMMHRLPLVDLPISEGQSAKKKSSTDTMKVKYGPCVWFFFGKNYNNTDEDADAQQSLLGRPEHTDSVSHDGTWHYQLSGTKIWRIRPTNELMHMIQENGDVGQKKQKLNDGGSKYSDECNTIEVECKQGDILLLNTRLWWHSTLIPAQDVPSISYARDVYFESNDSDDTESNQQSMTNIDGTYAAQDIEAETILFTEHTMPNCELHRSKTNPNCQVVELEDEAGESYMAVVSLKEIKAGEFFCVAESDSEVEEGDSEGEWEEEDVCKPCT